MEGESGDSVTLHTDVEINHQDTMKWYLNDFRIAQITGDQSKICTDEQCKERFRDRLKLDHQTGSLTITNTRTTDSGLYKLLISSIKIIQKIFHIAVHDNILKSVQEGSSVTLDSQVITNPNDLMRWFFNDILIAEFTGHQSKICTDDQCDERFRDRLTLDYQTGSLTITNTRTTDSGLYKLKIVCSIRCRHSISIIRIKRLSITVIGESGCYVSALVSWCNINVHIKNYHHCVMEMIHLHQRFRGSLNFFKLLYLT
uniref:Uncharacterized LOC107690502 n=1 Tax=Sinocyclocheilus anshuiensis TaxID=1608454 RepID=A0A671LWY2_9TELE